MEKAFIRESFSASESNLPSATSRIAVVLNTDPSLAKRAHRKANGNLSDLIVFRLAGANGSALVFRSRSIQPRQILLN